MSLWLGETGRPPPVYKHRELPGKVPAENKLSYLILRVLYLIASHRIASHRIASYCIVSYRILHVSYLFVLYLIVSCCIISYLILSLLLKTDSHLLLPPLELLTYHPQPFSTMLFLFYLIFSSSLMQCSSSLYICPMQFHLQHLMSSLALFTHVNSWICRWEMAWDHFILSMRFMHLY